MQRPRGTLITRDGASVLLEWTPEDPVEKIAVKILQEASLKMSRLVGDGTTTVVLLTCALVLEGRKRSWTPDSLEWLPVALNELTRPLRDPSDFRDYARAASHGDSEIAEAVASALWESGLYGVVEIDSGHSRGIDVLQRPGYVLDYGPESQDFLSHEESTRLLELPRIALVDGFLTDVKHIQPILEEASAFPSPLLVLSRGVFGEALKTILMNDRKLEGSFGRPVEWVASRVPGHHDIQREGMLDLAALSGATLVPVAESFDPHWFGDLQRASIGKNKVVLTAHEGSHEEEVLGRLHALQGGATVGDRDRRSRQAAMLSGSFWQIRVGAASDTERRERIARVEDALRATRSAINSGVCPGGGQTFSRLSEWCPDEVLGEVLRLPETWVGEMGDVEDSRELVESAIEIAQSTAAMLLSIEVGLIPR